MKGEGFFRFDKPLAIAAVALSAVGMIFIYSASSYSAELEFGDPFRYVETQAVALVLGVAVMLALSFVRPETVKKAALPLFAAGVLLLTAVFIPGLGVESYGAKRWLNFGFFTVQPSEYAKFALVVFLAAFAAKRGVGTFPRALVFLSAAGIVCLLLLLEPNMSVTICVGGRRSRSSSRREQSPLTSSSSSCPSWYAASRSSSRNPTACADCSHS